jgi:hypothetical protein
MVESDARALDDMAGSAEGTMMANLRPSSGSSGYAFTARTARRSR